jgi:hypothetical protein
MSKPNCRLFTDPVSVAFPVYVELLYSFGRPYLPEREMISMVSWAWMVIHSPRTMVLTADLFMVIFLGDWASMHKYMAF